MTSESGPVDFAALAARARDMQGAMADVQTDLQALQATGFGGGGLVAATVAGDGRIIGLRIDPSVIDPDDPETLAELVISAVDAANGALTDQRAERLSSVTDGLDGILAGLRPDRSGAGAVVPRWRADRAGRTDGAGRTAGAGRPPFGPPGSGPAGT